MVSFIIISYEPPNESENVPNKIEIQKKIGNKRVVFEIKAVDPTMK
jgi:hypothetical protein